MKHHRILSLCMALLLAALPLAACSEDTAETKDTAPAVESEPEKETETDADWWYPDVDYGGESYRMLNLDELWNMYIHMDVQEQTGEVLNDAVYLRNRKIEDRLNCLIVENEVEGGDHQVLIQQAYNDIKAATNSNEVMYLPINARISMVTDGCFMDLKTLPELQLEETWWDQDIIKDTTLGGKLYFVTGSSNLMAFDSMWCLFFNENMLADYGLERPYDTVKEGAWTLDKLQEYASAVSNLNGEDKFAWNPNGKCVWGISAHLHAPEKFYYSADVLTTARTEDGSMAFALENEHFYNVTNKLAVLLDQKGGLSWTGSTADFDVNAGGYVHIFSVRRSLFLTAEIKAAQLLRDMEDTFGIVPFPKYDENQEDYATTLVSALFYMTVPVTNQNLEMTATIAEVMTRESYNSVIPVYYSSVVEHKGLRNEESVEMLEIMRRTRGMDIAMILDWNTALRNTLAGKLTTGSSEVASSVASQKSAIEKKISQFMKFFTEE